MKRLVYVRDPGGMTRIGHDAENGFAYDNETPAHSAYLGAFRLANRAATSGEYLQFIDDGGYRRPELWLSEGWSKVTSENWAGPLYWVQHEGYWYEFTLAGLQRLDLSRPVCHISYFEADAFARWAGARLPTEFEWEHVATKVAVGAAGQETRSGVFADQLIDDGVALHPQRVDPASADFGDMLGNVWEWTSSAYAAYPGYRPSPGAIGEYNGKFMCNQYVLRGGSCATSSDHIRVTYRNFFPAHARWQFTGVRCAQDD
ncbi:MAG: SUMF1/EgtB/PvdO family nonheme iron enzyme [Aureliella sp.]